MQGGTNPIQEACAWEGFTIDARRCAPKSSLGNRPKSKVKWPMCRCKIAKEKTGFTGGTGLNVGRRLGGKLSFCVPRRASHVSI